MEVRDKLNTAEGYREIIIREEKYISESLDDIKKLKEHEEKGVQLYNRPNVEAIASNLDDILKYQYDTFIARYSLGTDVTELKPAYNSIVEYMAKRWKKSNGYIQMVWALSLGVMFNIEDEIFTELVKLVEKDNPNDLLIDYLITYRHPSWQGTSNNFMFKRPYQATEEIISLAQADKTKSLERLKKYVTKEWYRGHSSAGWYDAHKSKWNIHSGYWSFESGALVKILGLDDSSLIDTQYYPYDMVHWKS